MPPVRNIAGRADACVLPEWVKTKKWAEAEEEGGMRNLTPAHLVLKFIMSKTDKYQAEVTSEE